MIYLILSANFIFNIVILFLPSLFPLWIIPYTPSSSPSNLWSLFSLLLPTFKTRFLGEKKIPFKILPLTDNTRSHSAGLAEINNNIKSIFITDIMISYQCTIKAQFIFKSLLVKNMSWATSWRRYWFYSQICKKLD